MSGGVFEDRLTSLTIDDDIRGILQRAITLEKAADDIGLIRENIVDCVNVQGAGWQLRPFPQETAWEDTRAAAGSILLAAGKAPATIVEFDTQRQNTSTGITYDGNTQVSGTPMMRKDIAAGATWDSELAGDKATWVVPETGLDRAEVDRIFITNANHNPEQSLTVRLAIPGSISNVTSVSTIGGICFTGPAGKTPVGGQGTGQYYLKLLGDGSAILYERTVASLTAGTTTWIRRRGMQWAQAGRIIGYDHIITIESNAIQRQNGRIEGSQIGFRFSGINKERWQSEEAIGTHRKPAILAHRQAAGVALTDLRNFDFIYHVGGNKSSPTTLAPVRIDLRRDIRTAYALAFARYPTTGTIQDDLFIIDCLVDTSTPFTLQYFFQKPGTTTVNVTMHDGTTGVELSGRTLLQTTETAEIVTYTPNVRQTKYFYKITLGGDGTETPTLISIRLLRDGVAEEPLLTAVEVPKRTSDLAEIDMVGLQITGPTDNPENENATIRVKDYTGDLSTLRNKSLHPITVKTRFDGNPANFSILFKGFVKQAVYTRTPGGSVGEYPDLQTGNFTINAQGRWRILQEVLAPERYYLTDLVTGGPNKVTNIIKDFLIQSAGILPADVDVPDLGTRFWEDGASENWMIDVHQPISDLIKQYARDFFGGYIIFDPNAGADGMWRLLLQKVPPYNYLARFEVDHPGDLKASHVSGAYPDDTFTSPKGNTQTRVHTYIQQGTITEWPEPPEGNIVHVYGGGNATEASDQGTLQHRFAQIAVNFDSYNALNLDPAAPNYPDPTNADYIGREVPIKHYDYRLNSQEAVDWICRRIFDYACHQRIHKQFRAPLILVTDIDDPKQTNPRPLRYYDIVQVKNDDTDTFDDYIVSEVNPDFSHDRVQMAHYHLIRTSQMATRAALKPAIDGTRINRAFQMGQRVEGNSVVSVSFEPFPNAKAFADALSGIAGLPVPEITPPAGDTQPFQDKDPASGTFGDFGFMSGYDAH